MHEVMHPKVIIFVNCLLLLVGIPNSCQRFAFKYTHHETFSMSLAAVTCGGDCCFVGGDRISVHTFVLVLSPRHHRNSCVSDNG